MSKKRKFILFIIVILLVLVPAITFATIKIHQIPTINEAIIEEKNRQDREEALKEKEEYARKERNNSSLEQTISSDFTEEELEYFAKQKQNKEDKENRIKEIMSKYHPNEFNKILDDIQKVSENEGVVNLGETPVSQPERELYDLVLKVLEEKELSEDESLSLKDFINQQKSTIDKDSELKKRADNVLKSENE